MNYIFGAAERDGPEGPPAGNTPRLRKSFSRGTPGVLPFGSEVDIHGPASPGGLISPGGRAPGPRNSFGAPFKVDASAHFPNREEQLPSAPPPLPTAADGPALASVAKMSLPELRETLRNRGLSPAGGLAALQERLIDALKGLPLDTPAFVAQPSGIEWPSDDNDPSGKPAQTRPSIRVSTGGGGSGGGPSSLGYVLGGPL